MEEEINHPLNLPVRHPPEPGMLLVLTSIMQIGVYLSVAMWCCSGMFAAAEWSDALLYGTLVFFAAWLTWDQYRAVFRANRQAAEGNAKLLVTSFLLLGLLFLVLAFRAFFAPDRLMNIVTITFLAMLSCGVAAWQSRLWFIKLQHTPAIERADAARRFTLKEILLAITAISCVLAGSSYFVPRDQPRMGEHLLPNACPFEMPAAARDISFCYSPQGLLAYEFTIAEDGAMEWAGSLDLYRIQPISSPYTMSRYGRMHPRLRRNKSATITTGWATTGYVDGRQVTIAYDQEAQRAYYFTESR
jgi:hypothetical protein